MAVGPRCNRVRMLSRLVIPLALIVALVLGAPLGLALAQIDLAARDRVVDLRHNAATLALIQGVHPKVVSDMLGHGTVGLTLDTYAHLLPTMHQQAAAAMDAILAG